MKAFKKAISRRGVLRGFGGGAALGLTKNIPTEAKLTGYEISGLSSDHGQLSVAVSDGGSQISVIQKLAGKLPFFKERELREQSNWVRCLDPDLASLKSVSMSARVTIQRERNYQAAKRSFFDWPFQLDERNKWLKANGVDYL